MEAAYEAQRRADLPQISKLWCLVQLTLCLAFFAVLALRYKLPWTPSLHMFLPDPLPFLAIAVVLASNCLVGWRPYTHILMCASSLVIMGWEMWNVHFQVGQKEFLVRDLSLKLVYDALGNDADALAQLDSFVKVEGSKQFLMVSGVQISLQFNLMQFLGLEMWTAVVYLSLPVAMFMTTYLSPVMSHNVSEILAVACIATLTALLSSFHVSRLDRHRFETDHRLQAMLEREAEMLQRMADHERRTKETAIEADNILNHMLKNIMADASGLIWLFMANHLEPLPADLQQALGCLDRGMQWCRRRQALARITAGAYQLSCMPVELRAFGEALATGRTLDCNFVDDVVLLDPLLCDILLDNAINNALRHGDTPRGPVTFAMGLSPLDEAEAELTFTVRNWARADRPRLTPEFVEAVLRGETHSEPGNTLSDHLGLQHLFLAAKAHDARLTLQQAGDVVILRATLMVQRGVLDTVRLFGPSFDADLQDLRVLCLDDSEVARRLLQHTLSLHFPSCTVEVFGNDSQEVRDFMVAALDRGDVILIDNHLVYEDGQFFGPQILTDLFRSGFSGFACVRSANMSPEDQAEYFASGAHCCL
eukprot:EG_transcript_7019